MISSWQTICLLTGNIAIVKCLFSKFVKFHNPFRLRSNIAFQVV